MTKKALVILAEGFEEIEAVTPIDLLRRAGISVTVAGLSSITVKGARGIPICADSILDSCKEDAFDALILPGGQPGTTNLASSSTVLEMVRKSAHDGRLIAAICAAPSVLGKAGILQGKKATCYPGIEDALIGAELQDSLVVVDGNLITSRGAGTAIAFSLQIIRYLTDFEHAAKVASGIIAEFN